MIVLLMTNIVLQMGAPGIMYDLSRFTWTGYITEIRYHGQSFCAEAISEKRKMSAPSNIITAGRGLCAEFSVDDPPGYQECQVGDLFPKIGVGLLLKSDTNTYLCYRRYAVVKPFPIRYEQTNNAVIFYQDALPCQGYAFTLTKKIVLNSDGFVIEYVLSNAGQKSIATEEYCHNLIAINGQAASAQCSIVFPSLINVTNSVPKYLTVQSNAIQWESDTKKSFRFDVNSLSGSLSAWTYIDARAGVSISESASPKPSQVSVWANELQATSVEMFVPVKAHPGEVCAWKRTYRFETLNK